MVRPVEGKGTILPREGKDTRVTIPGRLGQWSRLEPGAERGITVVPPGGWLLLFLKSVFKINSHSRGPLMFRQTSDCRHRDRNPGFAPGLV